MDWQLVASYFTVKSMETFIVWSVPQCCGWEIENFVEHLYEFHLCKSTSVYWENSKLNFLTWNKMCLSWFSCLNYIHRFSFVNKSYYLQACCWFSYICFLVTLGSQQHLVNIYDSDQSSGSSSQSRCCLRAFDSKICVSLLINMIYILLVHTLDTCLSDPIQLSKNALLTKENTKVITELVK